MRTMHIAVDFDGTLCGPAKYPLIGDPNEQLIDLLKELRHLGHFLILWTCRSGKALESALRWCGEHGLAFDAVNPRAKKGASPKIVADVYIDDRACSARAFLARHGWY